MSLRTEATIDDLYRAGGKAELVGGEIVMMSPAGDLHSRIAIRIVARLLEYEEHTMKGHAVGDNVGFIVNLPNRRSFSPDVAYFMGPSTTKFNDGAPAFAVEIRSDGDYGPAAETELAEKRTDYFAAGTQVVWDIDPRSAEVVRVYRASAPERPTVYARGQIAEAEPALPGWTMGVDDMFPRQR